MLTATPNYQVYDLTGTNTIEDLVLAPETHYFAVELGDGTVEYGYYNHTESREYVLSCDELMVTDVVSGRPVLENLTQEVPVPGPVERRLRALAGA